MTTINDLERLLKSFINAAGYDVEDDRKVEGEKFYVISRKKKIIKEKEDNPDFTKFWFLYPRKTNCEKAKLSFNKLTKSEIILALRDIKTRYKGVEKQFIPHATTYINGKRWQDERIISSSRKTSGTEVKSVLQQIAQQHKDSGKSRYSNNSRDI